jgi:hypothetical protein
MRNYKFLKLEHCSKDGSIVFEPDVPENNFNDKLSVAGKFEVTEKLYGPIDLSFDFGRCTLDMNTCEKFSSRNFRNMCSEFQNPTTMVTKLVEKIVPALKCPVMPGNYTMIKTDLNLKPISFAPLDGSIFNINTKLITTNPTTKKRIVATCIRFEIKIIKERVKP